MSGGEAKSGGLEASQSDIDVMHAGIGALLVESAAEDHDSLRDERLGVSELDDLQLHLGVMALLRGGEDDDRGGDNPARLPKNPSQSPNGSALDYELIAA